MQVFCKWKGMKENQHVKTPCSSQEGAWPWEMDVFLPSVIPHGYTAARSQNQNWL